MIILDDAHAAENYVATLWTLRVERPNPKHAILHLGIQNVLKQVLDPLQCLRLSGGMDRTVDRTTIDKLPGPVFATIRTQLIEVLDEHAEASGLEHPWSMLRDHLYGCQLYFSSNEILMRPLIPPTWSHDAFQQARQRVYMSATLGAGGDLERLMGRKSIFRIPIPEGWDRQGVGRRFFIFPEMSLKDGEIVGLRHDLLKRAGRSLMLVPSDKLRAEIVNDVEENLGFKVFSADDIETSKESFVTTDNAVAIVANRYDGIDFPGDECRLLFVEGLPKAMNLQERFLMTRMAANLLFNERVQTRILQAIGRCTRSLEDFSAVVVSGEDLPEYLVSPDRRKYLHPELQAEVRFGVEQSKAVSPADLSENFATFLENGKAWEEVNRQIVAYRKNAAQESFPAMEELAKIVLHEVEFQAALWQGDYEAAVEAGESVLGGLSRSELRGYRSLWHYLTGTAAWLAFHEANVRGFDKKARDQFQHAKKSASGIPWMVGLSRMNAQGTVERDPDTVILEQVERIECNLEKLGTLHDRAFAKREAEILKGLESKDKGTFEQAHKGLGEMLGFTAGKIEAEGSPDPWWVAANYCFVFEDHAGAESDSVLDVTKARQVFTHPNWIKEHVPVTKDAEILPVLVSPVRKAKQSAFVHLDGVALWPLSDFRTWAANALSSIRKLRTSYVESGDLVWRANAAEALVEDAYDAPGLMKKLKGQSAQSDLIPVK